MPAAAVRRHTPHGTRPRSRLSPAACSRCGRVVAGRGSGRCCRPAPWPRAGRPAGGRGSGRREGNGGWEGRGEEGRGSEEAGRRGRGLAQFGRCMGCHGGLAGQVSQPNTAGPVADGDASTSEAKPPSRGAGLSLRPRPLATHTASLPLDSPYRPVPAAPLSPLCVSPIHSPPSPILPQLPDGLLEALDGYCADPSRG